MAGPFRVARLRQDSESRGDRTEDSERNEAAEARPVHL